jgi:hypothetical protein
MSLCFYDVLERTLLDIEKWKANASYTKEDVLDAIRKRIVMLMRHVQTTPMIGSAYAYPGEVVYVGSPSPAIGMILAAHLKYPIATKV